MTEQPSNAPHARHRAILLEHLRSADERCPNCGYELRGCTSDRCPECGDELRLMLGRRSAAPRGWLTATFGLGFSVVILVPMVYAAVMPVADALANPQKKQLIRLGMAPNDLPNWTVVLAITTLTAIAVALLALAISSRGSFARLPRPVQTILAFAGALAPLAVIGAAALLIAWL